MEWNKKVKELREKLCLSQTELAELVGVAFISINRYETGKNKPTIRVKRKLLELFKENKITEE